MRRDGFFNMRFLLIRLDYLPKALTRHALAADVDKQRLLGGQRDHLRSYKFYVLIKCLDRSRIQRDKALFFRVGRTPYNAGRCVDVANVQRDKLADSDAGCVKQLKHGPVSIALCIGARGLLKQKINFLARQYLRKLMLAFFRSELNGWIFADISVLAEHPIHAFERCNGTRHSCNRFSVSLEPVNILGKLVLCCADYILRRVRLHVVAKLADITHIGAEGICGTLFDLNKILIENFEALRIKHPATPFLGYHRINSATETIAASISAANTAQNRLSSYRSLRSARINALSFGESVKALSHAYTAAAERTKTTPHKAKNSGEKSANLE